LTNNVKEPTKTDALAIPLFRGDRCAEIVVTVEANRVAHRVGGMVSTGGYRARQTLFCIFQSAKPKRREIRRF